MNNVTSPRTDDEGLEARLAAKSTAPRITLQDLRDQIAECHFFSADHGVQGRLYLETGNFDMELSQPLRLLTFCVLVLKNGFTVTGESACASPANYDPLIGQEVAYKNAVEKMWPLLGYQLKDRLYHEAVAVAKFEQLAHEAHRDE